MPGKEKVMIELQEISKTYRTDFWAKEFWPLDKVSFRVEEGGLVGFLGANGAGKTTAIKIIMRFIRPREGRVVFNPLLGKDFKSIFGKIGYIPERPYFYPHLTGREFVTYMGQLNGVKSAVISTRMQHWAERFLITYALDRKLSGFSKGMLQRIGFVAALIHDPLLLILDEPISGLDPIGRKEIKDCLKELHRSGKTIFFTSHIVSDVEEICDKVVVLEKGKLLYQGAIDQLIEENIRPNYVVRLADYNQFTLPSYVQNFDRGKAEIPVEKREEYLAAAISSGCKVVSVQQNRPSLEQIIYEIRPNL